MTRDGVKPGSAGQPPQPAEGRGLEPGASSTERWLRVQQVVDQSIDRRLAGETLADEQIIAAHQDLLPELAAELGHLAFIEQARHRAGGGAAGSAGSPAEGADAAAAESDELSDYEILDELRPGPGVAVLHAIHDTSDHEVVIKIFETPDARAESEFVEELGRVQAVAAEAVARPCAWGRMARGPFYVISDFVAGETLADHVQRYCAGGDLRPAVEMLARCAERVGALHAAGCAHGRLTPGNVLIDRDGQPHLLDVAQAALHGTAQVAEAGQPHSRRQGATADVLALGVLFDEALGRAPSAAGRARLPAALAEVLRPCRDADPLRRYATAGELAEALRRWLAPEAPQTPPHRPASRVQRLQQGLRRFLRRTSDGPPPGL